MISSSRTFARASAARRFGRALRPALGILAVGLFAPGAAGTTGFDPARLEPRGYLSDFAGIVPGAYRDSIEALGSELERATGAQVGVATLAELQGESIEPVAVDLFARWGVGGKGRDDGVLILLALRERRVRIEVGYGLEGILPDGRCGAIIRRVMAPDLARGRYGPGLLRGAEAVAAVIARDRGVALQRGGAGGGAGLEDGRDDRAAVRTVLLFGLALLIAALILNRFSATPRWWGGEWSDWRTRRRRRGPWGGFDGGIGGFGGFGGFGGGGSGGGGFGGFGGGRSGGGGASGGF